MLDVLVACKEPKAPGGLEHLGEHHVFYGTAMGWAHSSNWLLEHAAVSGFDALFCDDDVTFTETSLDGVHAHYDDADLFGLDLHDAGGFRQAGARHVMDAHGGLHDWIEAGPAYVAHCSTSAIYIKTRALAALRFPIWDGVHYEDVAFCLDAWLKGFRVMAVPGYVHHDIVGGVGSTKRHTSEFWAKWQANQRAFGAWCAEHDVTEALADERIPTGAREL